MNNHTILSVNQLKKLYPVKGGFFSRQKGELLAVNGVSFYILRNTNLGLVGESGSGKTTVGKCILRLIEPTAGQIRFEGIDVNTLDRKGLMKLRQRMQMIYQDPFSSLDPRMTVERIIGEGLTIHRIAKGIEKRDLIANLLRRVGMMPEDMKRHPHEFSGGQRQRIGIARALALNPKLVIADEPVSALDVSIQAQVINLMMDLQEDFGLSYLIIAHDLAVVQHMCSKIAVMYLGSIVEFADSEVFYESPKHPYSISLLSAVPIPNPELRVQKRILRGEIPSPSDPPLGCPFHPRCPENKIGECEILSPRLVDIGNEHFVACHLRTR